jgi:sigma-B regulation protein RsbU (phosphoserine phosphatase)
MPSPQGVEPKLLYRRLDSLFSALDPARPQRDLLESFLEEAFRTLKDDLRLRSGMLYTERRDAFELLKHVGERDGLPEEMSPAVPPLSLVLKHRAYIFVDTESWIGQLPLPMHRAAAAMVVGRRPNRYLFFFLLADGWAREELDFALNTVRVALGSRLVDERVRGSFQQAAEIQQSLLVEEPPAFPGYDIACRSIPAEEVGGDFYDFSSFEADMLGIAIGDASGHGLPAALLVRDVVTGLRMGLERELKVIHVFEKLNRVIHRSNLSSRFVSLFYGELEQGGNLIYVNAGHPPPLLISGEGTARLDTGGTVIGPLAEARFHRGIVRIEPGSTLVLTTDGILERRGKEGELGEEGVLRILAEHPGAGAEELIETLFGEAFKYGGGRSWEDDATAVIVRRLSSS